jgi:hypothetical protein
VQGAAPRHLNRAAAVVAILVAAGICAGVLLLTLRNSPSHDYSAADVRLALNRAGFRHVTVQSLGTEDCGLLGLCPDGVDPSTATASVSSNPPSGHGAGVYVAVMPTSADAASTASNMRRAPDRGSTVIVARRNLVVQAPRRIRNALSAFLSCLDGC